MCNSNEALKKSTPSCTQGAVLGASQPDPNDATQVSSFEDSFAYGNKPQFEMLKPLYASTAHDLIEIFKKVIDHFLLSDFSFFG